MTMYGHRFWVPLINFEFDKQEIKLAGGFVIKRIPNNDTNALFEIEEYLPSTDNRQEFILECVIQKPEVTPYEAINKYGRPQVEKALTILRLFKEQLIGFNYLIYPYSDQENYEFSIDWETHCALDMNHKAIAMKMS